MEAQRSGYWRWMIAAIILLSGLVVGGLAGGIAGYMLAAQGAEATPVAQPALSGESTPTEEALPLELVAEPPTPTPGGDPIVTAVQRVQPATVRVMTPGGSGSGVIISDEGYIVTNHHVVANMSRIEVLYDRGERLPAQLIGSSPDFDLAVLKVDAPVPAVASWGDSSSLPLGSPVIAIGSALGDYQNTVTLGILSGVNRSLAGLPGLLQTDAAINHGNSGGPLVNHAGEVVGINTLVVRGGGAEAEGLGFAIPSNIARAITAQLIEHGQAARPLMGVQVETLNSQLAEQYGLSVMEGGYIVEVFPESPSEQAGLRPGDVVLAFDGRPVTDRETLQMHVLSRVPGDQVTLTLLRDGSEMELQLTLAAA